MIFYIKQLNDSFGKRTIYINEQGGQFEANSDNTDYQAYLAWCEEGNTPLPADEGVA